MDDYSLLAQFAATGEPDAFGELVRRYEPLVRGAALRQVTNAHLAQDISQSTMIVLLRKAGKIRRNRPLGPWLLRVTHFLAIDALRGESARRKHERLAARQRHESDARSATSPWPSIEPVIDQALHALGNKDRTILTLRYLQDWAIERIARELHLTPQATRQRLSRALRRLRSLLARRAIRNDDLLPAFPLPLAARIRSAGNVLFNQFRANAKRTGRSFPAKMLTAFSVFAILTGGVIIYRTVTHRTSLNPLTVTATSGRAIGMQQMSISRPNSTIP